MISVEEATALIPDNKEYSDDQIKEIICTLDELANICFDIWLAERNKPKKE